MAGDGPANPAADAGSSPQGHPAAPWTPPTLPPPTTPLLRFVHATLTPCPDGRLAVLTAYAAWARRCAHRDIHPGSLGAFSTALRTAIGAPIVGRSPRSGTLILGGWRMRCGRPRKAKPAG